MNMVLCIYTVCIAIIVVVVRNTAITNQENQN